MDEGINLSKIADIMWHIYGERVAEEIFKPLAYVDAFIGDKAIEFKTTAPLKPKQVRRYSRSTRSKIELLKAYQSYRDADW